MQIAIVIPIYNEEENLPELRQRLFQALESVENIEWKVIFVNDGSHDRSVEIIQNYHQEEPRFCLIDLSRNFGHQAALTAGLSLAEHEADAVILMDGDLQDPPEVIPDLIHAWKEGGEVVRAVRRSRAEKGLRRLGFELFHAVFGWISDFPIPTQTGIFGLLDRKALQHLNALEERNRFLPGLRSWIGFEQRTIEYDRKERAGGEPKQTLSRLIRYALDGIFSFSYKPLRVMTFLGICVSVIAASLAVFYASRRLLGIEKAEMGFTTIVTLVLLMGGVQLIAIGVLGEYLARIYDEVKRRPLFIVKEHTGLKDGTFTVQEESVPDEEDASN